MRFTPIVAWAVLAYGSLADDAQKVLSDESSASAAESATASVDTSLPTFTVSLFPNPQLPTTKGALPVPGLRSELPTHSLTEAAGAPEARADSSNWSISS